MIFTRWIVHKQRKYVESQPRTNIFAHSLRLTKVQMRGYFILLSG